jgi:hypothetical protein
MLYRGFTVICSGSGCLAAVGNNQSLQRGYIKSITPNSYEVYLVDYGNTQCVSTSQIMELPAQLSQIQPLAIQLTLTGAQDLPSDPGVNGIFQYLVKDKVLKLFVRQSDSTVPSCVLLDNNNANILQLLEQMLVVVVDKKQQSSNQGKQYMYTLMFETIVLLSLFISFYYNRYPLLIIVCRVNNIRSIRCKRKCQKNIMNYVKEASGVCKDRVKWKTICGGKNKGR